MSYIAYKLLHYLGAFLLVAVLGAALGRRLGDEGDDPFRRWWGALHGLALLMLLVAGFGLMARIGVDHGAGFPGWIWLKLGLWAVLAVLPFLARRRGGWALPLLVLVPVLAFAAGWAAFTKPF